MQKLKWSVKIRAESESQKRVKMRQSDKSEVNVQNVITEAVSTITIADM